MTHWISQEAAAQALFNFYEHVGFKVTYEQVLNKIIKQCESGEIPSISIPAYMKNKAHLN